MEFNFFTAEDLLFHGELPSPIDVLRQSHWKLDDYNAPFLVGKVKKLDHSYGLLSDEEVESRYNPKLKMGNPETDDEKKIVGDISDGLKPSSEVIIADVRNFIKAEETAKQLGYRPAKAGEFLQMLWYLRC